MICDGGVALLGGSGNTSGVDLAFRGGGVWRIVLFWAFSVRIAAPLVVFWVFRDGGVVLLAGSGSTSGVDLAFRGGGVEAIYGERIIEREQL